MFQTFPFIITMLCFRIPARTYEFFLVMFFTTDEINKNPYLLPNMSLMFSIIVNLCQDTLGVLDKIYSQENNTEVFMNYICGKYQSCYVHLTGPSWKTSLKLAVNSRISQVRMCDTGWVNNIKFHLNVPSRKLW